MWSLLLVVKVVKMQSIVYIKKFSKDVEQDAISW